MLASVSAATLRFRRRLLLAAFLRGVTGALVALLAAAAIGWLAMRLVDPTVLASVDRWLVWAIAGALALLWGAVCAWRCRPSEAFVVEHLERRLQTNGLLLAAADGAVLATEWERRLAPQLAAVGAAMPTIRWRALFVRPALAAAILAAVHVLPEPPVPAPATEAVVLAAERLMEQATQLQASPEASDARVEELRKQAEELLQRAQHGEADLWRELDRLEEQLRTEQQSSDAGAQLTESQRDIGQASSDAFASAEAEAARADQLAEELAEAAAAMAEMGDFEGLPEDLKEMLAGAAADAAGAIDPELLRSLLPEDLAALQELAERFGEAAGEMGRELAQSLSAEQLRQLAQLAQALASQGPSGAGSEGAQSNAPAAGASAAAGRQPGGEGSLRAGSAEGAAGEGPFAEAPGAGIDGGGHTALRLTEDARGGVGDGELELPSPGDLPGEWLPVDVQKGVPEVSASQSAAAGRAGARGSGKATWQLRLKPRHREIVRRFFAKDKR